MKESGPKFSKMMREIDKLLQKILLQVVIDRFTLFYIVYNIYHIAFIMTFTGRGEERGVRQLLWHRAGEGWDAGHPKRNS